MFMMRLSNVTNFTDSHGNHKLNDKSIKIIYGIKAEWHL